MSSRTIGIEEARKILGDLVDEVAEQGTEIVLTRHRKPLVSMTPYQQENAVDTLPNLTESTSEAVAALIDATVEHEYGYDETLPAARQAAYDALTAELRSDCITQDGDDFWLASRVDIIMRILIRVGLAARVCQCRQIHPLGCPHGSASGSIWCAHHYQADVPPLGGALLCGNCHGGEYQTSIKDGA